MVTTKFSEKYQAGVHFTLHFLYGAIFNGRREKLFLHTLFFLKENEN